MRDNYDFTNSDPNLYIKESRRSVIVCLDKDVIDHFKQLSEQNGIPYQDLIHLYLKDCVKSNKKLKSD